jgi:hypothetical protein
MRVEPGVVAIDQRGGALASTFVDHSATPRGEINCVSVKEATANMETDVAAAENRSGDIGLPSLIPFVLVHQ